MDEHGTFAAALLDASRKGLASLVVERARQAATDPEIRALLATPAATSDVEQRLAHLAESAATGLPELFAAHVEWSAATCAVRGVAAGFLPALISALADVLEQELPVDSWKVLRPHLEAARAVLARPASPLRSRIDGPSGDRVRSFLLAALEGRRDDALKAVEQALAEGTPVETLQRDMIGAALAEVGSMWQSGEAHVGEERQASAIATDALALLRRRAQRKAAHGGRVLVASVEGNLHDLGARIVADRLEQEGWTTFFLGANVPTADLLRAAADHEVDVLALSAGLGIHARAAARVVAAAHGRSPKPLPVVVGGQIFERVDGLWRAIGADAGARGPEEAVAACARLMS